MSSWNGRIENQKPQAFFLDVLDHAGIHSALEPFILRGIAVSARSFSGAFSGAELLLHGLVHRRQEDHLAVGSLGHGLHGFEVSDLHGGSRGEDIGSLVKSMSVDVFILRGANGTYLTHQLVRFDLGTSTNNLALTDPLRLGSHGKRVLQLIAEDDILDQHGLYQDTPGSSHFLDDLRCRLSDLLATLNHVLQHPRTNDMAECGLGALDEGLLDIGDSECGLVRRNDLVVDHGGQGKRDVVLGHADLARHFDDLNLDIDCLKILTQRVNLDKTGVHGAFEAVIYQYPV